MSVFPNPSSTGWVTIQFDKEYDRGDLILFDMNGQIVLRTPIANQKKFKLYLDQGIYLCKIILEREVCSKKLIVE